MLTAPVWIQGNESIWPFEVVAQAHEQLPALQFDIYGRKVEEAEQLAPPVQELAAQDYIHLLDHADLKQIYPCYQALPHHFSVGRPLV